MNNMYSKPYEAKAAGFFDIESIVQDWFKTCRRNPSRMLTKMYTNLISAYEAKTDMDFTESELEDALLYMYERDGEILPSSMRFNNLMTQYRAKGKINDKPFIEKCYVYKHGIKVPLVDHIREIQEKGEGMINSGEVPRFLQDIINCPEFY